MEGPKVIKNIFKMSRIQVDKSKNSAKMKKRQNLTQDKIDIFQNLKALEATPNPQEDESKKPGLFKENISDEEYEYSSSSEE